MKTQKVRILCVMVICSEWGHGHYKNKTFYDFNDLNHDPHEHLSTYSIIL